MSEINIFPQIYNNLDYLNMINILSLPQQNSPAQAGERKWFLDKYMEIGQNIKYNPYIIQNDISDG